MIRKPKLSKNVAFIEKQEKAVKNLKSLSNYFKKYFVLH